ncbi:MAG: Sua5/YciO/YrdC/YwlC family protein, partial [Cryomorphaceae bacterium]
MKASTNGAIGFWQKSSRRRDNTRMQDTYEIVLSGQVQGVGFRPFVFNLARKNRLKGWVCNSSHGVLIHINSSEEEAKDFLASVLEGAPAISEILESSLKQIPSETLSDFEIIASKKEDRVDIPLTPDFAICDSCKTEIRDPDNRRFGYPFTTCTNCGPRYAVTTKFPFERAHTTVEPFQMCGVCQSEYDDPTNRRFHSQTNTCTDCGVHLKLSDAKGANLELEQSQILRKAAELILKGSILAIKNTNGYLLCCDSNNEEAIAELRRRKRRPTKPFALLYPSIEDIKTQFTLSQFEEAALVSSTAPIVILNPKREAKLAKSQIAPGLNRLGVMVPSSALLTLLMDEVQIPIVATSGNIHGSPIISIEAEALELLSGLADYFVHHNLDISFPQDDSVLCFADDQPIVLRRSRGMAPNYLSHKHSVRTRVLAMGAHLKSSFTFLPNAQT